MTRAEASEIVARMAKPGSRNSVGDVTIKHSHNYPFHWFIRRRDGGVILAKSERRAALYLQQAVNRTGPWRARIC